MAKQKKVTSCRATPDGVILVLWKCKECSPTLALPRREREQIPASFGRTNGAVWFSARTDSGAHLERCDRKYNSSTFALAQGVLRRNFKLDLMLGS